MRRKPPYRLQIPYVKNAMSKNAFEFMRRNIHFYDNSKIKHKGVRGYNPLFNVIYPWKINMKGIRGIGNAINHVTLDNSMIKYMGRAITYVQYMPAKPINHGIKVFEICCALSIKI